nr:uncharacterized protein LOC105861225 [Microcebus murinus]
MLQGEARSLDFSPTTHGMLSQGELWALRASQQGRRPSTAQETRAAGGGTVARGSFFAVSRSHRRGTTSIDRDRAEAGSRAARGCRRAPGPARALPSAPQPPAAAARRRRDREQAERAASQPPRGPARLSGTRSTPRRGRRRLPKTAADPDALG